MGFQFLAMRIWVMSSGGKEDSDFARCGGLWVALAAVLGHGGARH